MFGCPHYEIVFSVEISGNYKWCFFPSFYERGGSEFFYAGLTHDGAWLGIAPSF
jgi:hypothetical protein